MFITIEGADGSGKTTQIERLKEHINLATYSFTTGRPTGHNWEFTSDPGGTDFGKTMKRIIMGQVGKVGLLSEQELFLFTMSRAVLVEDVIRPWLDQDKVVFCDRYIDSTIVYQHFYRGIAEPVVIDQCMVGAQGVFPDITIFLDVSLEKSIERAEIRSKGNGESNKFDHDEKMTETVIKGYRDWFRDPLELAVPSRWGSKVVHVDADGTEQATLDQILEIVRPFIP